MEQKLLLIFTYAAPFGWLLTLMERKALVECMRDNFGLFIGRVAVINLPTVVILIEVIKELLWK